MVSRAQLTSMKRMGFSDEDYAEWLKRSVARREDIQAHELTLKEMAETGATGRAKLREAGLGKRLGREHEFRRPEQTARVGEFEARAGEARGRTAAEEYALGFKKSEEQTIRDILRQSKELGKLDIKALQQDLDVEAAVPGEKVSKAAVPAVTPKGVAKPGKGRRKLRPWIRREVFGGPRAVSPLARAAYGYRNIADWLKFAGRKGIEYAFPRSE